MKGYRLMGWTESEKHDPKLRRAFGESFGRALKKAAEEARSGMKEPEKKEPPVKK